MDIQEVILREIRENRKEIANLRIDVTALKVKFGAIAILFGFMGSLVKPFLLFLGGTK